MIHPIQVEADLLASNPKRPQLFLPRQKAAISYNKDGRRLLEDGAPRSPTSPNSLWNRCFLRTFTHRLAAIAGVEKLASTSEAGFVDEQAEKEETGSIDSFIDVVDLKPATNQEVLVDGLKQVQDRNNNEEDDILPETFIQGPKGISRGLSRRTSQKIDRNLIKPLIETCCTHIQKGYKEFLRLDFSHTNFNQNIEFNPETYGKRIWTHSSEKARNTLKNAICFKISNVAARADTLSIKLDINNPARKPTFLEVIIHLHVATEKIIYQLLYRDETTIQLPAECPEGAPFEFDIPLNAEIRKRTSPKEFLLLTMMGHVRLDGSN